MSNEAATAIAIQGEAVVEPVEATGEPMRVSISAGEMTFSPVSYNTFKVGAVFVSSNVLPGETPETTAERLTRLAIDSQRRIYVEQRKLFWESFEQKHVN